MKTTRLTGPDAGADAGPDAGPDAGAAVIGAVAICPHPPLLVPQIAGAAAPEADALRVACDTAVAGLLAALPDQVVIIGGDDAGGQGDPATGLRGFAPGLADLPAVALPLSLAIGDWLLDRAAAAAAAAGPAGPAGSTARHEPARQPVGVRADGTPVDGWPDLRGRIGLLVMGDGTARRAERSPGYLDERAVPLDAAIVKALADADVDALAALDPRLCAELLVGGVGAWKALATLARSTGGSRWTAELLYDDAPYGVQYTVAAWRPA